MKKQRILFSAIILSLLLGGSVFLNEAGAAGSATVSWIAPTTDQGGGPLTGLSGYKVFYDTASHWKSSCPLDAGTAINVKGGNLTSHYFENNLTPGQTYYFAVVAYDNASTPNVSGCATGTGGVTEVSKLVSYTADINTANDSNHKVDLMDFNTFRGNWGKTDCANIANFVGKTNDCVVNLIDFNVLRADYGKSFQ